jgi:hypothetical protein
MRPGSGSLSVTSAKPTRARSRRVVWHVERVDSTDPATSSAPFVATLVDVTGRVIYFTVAMVALRGSML